MTTVLSSDMLAEGAFADTLEEGSMTLEQVVHRIATDSAFSAAFRADPEGTLRREGARLTPEEVGAIASALDQENEPKAGLPWFESLIDQTKPQAGLPWFEAQLGIRPT
jgi:hypothetical protein